MKLGLDRNLVLLVPHRPEWKSLFESEANLLREILGDHVIAVEHIGSTAVSGLDAKPIIDILCGVRNIEDAEKCVISFFAVRNRKFRELVRTATVANGIAAIPTAFERTALRLSEIRYL